MALGFAKRLGTLLLMLLIVYPAYGEGTAIYVDRSGSMKSYYRTHLVLDLSEEIYALVQSHGRSKAHVVGFSETTTPAKSIQDLEQLAVGDYTYLDRAITDAINKRYSILWMITDNLQDEKGGEEGGNTAAFYRILKSNKVKKVVIFPIVRSPNTGWIEEGAPGIVIYGVQLSSSADDEFEREISEFTSKVKKEYGTECLRMKPLNEKSVESLFVKSAMKGGKDQVVYNEGDDIQGSMEIRFKSNFEHLRITDAEVTPDIKYEFGNATLFTFEKTDISITPSKVQELDPGSETMQSYSVTVDIGKVRLKRDLASLWKAAWGQLAEDGSLNFSFVIRVPRENFKFKQAFLATYSAPTTQLARDNGKVFAIDQLPSLLAEEVTTIPVESPQPFRVKYPWWPAPMFLMIGLTLVALLVAGGRFATGLAKGMEGRPKWEVEVTSPSPAKGRIHKGAVSVPIGGRPVTVGKIQGGNLTPASMITPKNAQQIKEGHPLKVVYRNSEVTLIFRRSSTQKKPSERRSSKNVKRSSVKI